MYIAYGFRSLLTLKMSRERDRQRSNLTIQMLREFAGNLFDTPIVFFCEPKATNSRAHLNDLENIPAFLFVSFLYVLTNPALGFATTLFRAFTIARIVHTFVYAVKPLPQPSRALAFGVGLLTTGYMAVQVLIHFW
jgi:uncharacterized MAPEG superfamily protein